MVQGAVAGLAAGGVYAVVAVCLVLMARLVRVVNLAQAATGMFGGFVAVWAVTDAQVPVVPAIVVGLVVAAGLSAALGWILATFMADADTARRSAATVGPLLLLVSLSFILFGNKPQPFPPLVSGSAFTVGGVVVSQVALVTTGLAVGVALICWQLLERTRMGLRLRALSERPTTAELLGIPARTLSIVVWAVTGLVSGLAVVVVAPTQSSDATALSLLVVPAAAAALLGAFRRLDLAVLGGLGLGALQGAVATVDALSLVRSFVPLLVIVVLLLWSQRREVWDAAR